MRVLEWIATVFLLSATAAAADDAAAANAPAPSAPTVTIVPATMAEVQARVPLSGDLVALQEVQVFPQVSGFEIVALNVEAGDRVTKGQELARLSDATLNAQLAQADAELQRATAGVSQSQSQISSTDAALKQAVTALDRAKSLKRTGNASQAALDQAVAAEAAAQAAAASAKDGLAVAKAAEAQARAARDIAQLNVDRTHVLSPVDGLVTARSAELGALSGSAAEPMFTLIADGAVEMKGEVIETALLTLKPGDKTEVDVAGVGRIEGTVRLLPAAVDPVTRLGEVRVALPVNDRLRTGLFASGEIITAQRQAVTVPTTAVLADTQGERVQVVTDGKVESREVKAGLLWKGRREIVEGLNEGEYVMERAGAFFRTGDVVNGMTPEQARKAAEDAAAETNNAGEKAAP